MVNIIFIYHHKTGHNLTRDLAKIYKEKYNINIIINKIKPRFFKEDKEGNIILNNLEILNDNNIFIQGSPYLKLTNDDIKIVHFIRDPYKMCLSSYLYHKQNPTPENWVNTINPFNHNKNILKYLIKNLDISLDNIDEILKLLDEIYDKNKSYYENLLLLDSDKGLQMEAIRAIISNGMKAGGDILRMGYIYENLKFNKNCINIRMEKINNNKLIFHEIKKLNNFIFKNDKIKDIIDIKNKIIEIQNNKEKNGNHITKNYITKKEKNKLILNLRNNKTISKILNCINN